MHIRCELGIVNSLQVSQRAELTFILENAGSEVVQVLNWQTPFEGIRAPMFTITRDEVEVEYRGPMLKRGAPQQDDYIMMKPGDRREAKINLAHGWDVDVPGSYKVEYSARLFDVIARAESAPRAIDQFKELALECNSVTFTRSR